MFLSEMYNDDSGKHRIGGSVIVPCRSTAQQKGAILLLSTVHFSPPDINLLADWAVKASCLSTCVFQRWAT